MYPEDEVQEEDTQYVFDLSTNVYIYKAYRYVGDSSDKNPSERVKWDLDSAIEDIESKTGDYTDNKQFVDGLIFDGLFTEDECKQIRPTSVLGIVNLGSGKSIVDIKNLLLAKQINL